ncbi:C2 domain-containing protein At1g53590-like isoform X2 [Asparagus officinalis]|uniref:C2 domain-containing protein At1g53590-like isoform X2 n=1 Tax=Asparagus officinalis TaxID=4686 RepID=UPI00098E0511|nr:C2 domain-containing protein At1g53590-like isoform X2 [Asparagus officinalis]
MDVTQVSLIHHIALVLLLLWVFTSLGWAHPVVFFISLLYLYAVNEQYLVRLRRKLQYEERKSANQRRLLSDSESVRWLNHAVEKVWPICMEYIASQIFLQPVIPWFLEKYKPWTAKEAVVQHLYLGRRPPMLTDIRVLGESVDDDHLVLELGMNFLSADDMSIILAVQPRMGFGMWANMHITGMHVEGKVLVGVKFIREWPFLGRMRICFVEPPYFQMTVKPIFNHGVDVTELPGIAGWLDNMLAVAFEQTLVEPNMLVVDVEKFATSPKEKWYTMDEKAPIAHAKVEIIEAADLKPSDMNGLADPYVKAHLGPYRFRTKVQKKTLFPKWLEEFKVPITSWETPNLLVLELRDKDHIFDDVMGDCAINITELRGGQRHDKWLPLQNIKMGRMHLAITVLEGDDDKKNEQMGEYQNADDDNATKTIDADSPKSNFMAQNQDTEKVSNKGSRHMVDEFEAINIEGQEKTGIWVHHPGSDVSQSWEPRKGRARRPETRLHCETSEGFDSPRSAESGSHLSDNTKINEDSGKRSHRLSSFRRGIQKIGSIFHSKDDELVPSPQGNLPTPHANLRSVDEKGTSVRVIYDDGFSVNNDICSPEKSEGENTKRGKVKGIAKNIIKQAGKPAHALKNVLSRKGSFSMNEDQESEMDEKLSQGSESIAVEGNAMESIEVKQEGSQPSPGIEKDVENSAEVEENGKVGKSATS